MAVNKTHFAPLINDRLFDKLASRYLAEVQYQFNRRYYLSLTLKDVFGQLPLLS